MNISIGRRRGLIAFAAWALISALQLAAADEQPGKDLPDSRPAAVSAPAAPASEIEQLKAILAEQQRQINELRQELANLKNPSANPLEPGTRRSLGEVASTTPMIPLGTVAAAPPAVAFPPAPQAPGQTESSNAVQKAIDAINSNLRGFRLSGDLRFRFDLLDRSANTSLPPSDNRSTPQQRARERYRVRFNVDKDMFFSEKADHPLAHFHLQLATDPYNNPITMDTDFSGIATRAPFSIAEAYLDLTPLKGLTFRAGRTPELYADNRQFVYDDDIRFNGFHEIYRWNAKQNGIFVEAKAAQYILTDPNTQIVPAGSPFLAAGYKVGQRIPSANLFDQGVTVGSNLGKKWSHNETVNYFAVREPNQIQLASTAGGAALFANNPIVGATLIGSLGGTGNATTSAGGATYFASNFHVVRGGFNLNYAGSQWMGHNFPFQLFLQGTHNTGAKFDQNGYMLGASLGQVARLGDFQLQYQYFYKPANAFISQFSDDDVGTGSGVNVKTNQIRVNIGLTRFLVWENRLYIQHGISVSNPSINYFLPLQDGYKTQIRLHSQFVFTF
jgi:hypothetical protein